jgi:hypothetical protein
MIHYILLPAGERHALRREYRLRLGIVLLLFVSFGLVIGMVSLVPSYLYTLSQEKRALVDKEAVQKSRIENGADQVEKDLVLSQAIAEKIWAEKDPVVYNMILEKIISHRKKSIQITAFQLNREVATTTIAKLSVEGKAPTRESLLQFKTELENDKTFTDIVLPLADLSKSKDLIFSMRLKVRKPQ